jgi:hypothetical protein
MLRAHSVEVTEAEFRAVPAAESVDILCIGSGSAGLAAGIAGADAGLQVLVADPAQRVVTPAQTPVDVESWTTLLQRRWGTELLGDQTSTYLDEMTSSLGPASVARKAGHLPVGTVETFTDLSGDPTQTVPPFRGSELATWARQCLASPFGMILSRVSTSTLTPMRQVHGTDITATRIVSVPMAARGEVTVREWLSDVARDRNVTVNECSVQGLLFNRGQPVGAVLDTPDGARSVRARRGVLLGTSCSTSDAVLAMSPMAIVGGATLCVVGRTASRFARLEFLHSAAALEQCAPPGRLA